MKGKSDLRENGINSKFKLAVRKLFSKAFGLPYVAPLSAIKKVFTNFCDWDATHWYCLVDRCESRLQLEDDFNQPNVEPEVKVFKSKVEEIKHHIKVLSGVYWYNEQYFLSESVDIVVHSLKVGQIGFNKTTERWYFANRTMSNFQYGDCVEEVVNIMLKKCEAM